MALTILLASLVFLLLCWAVALWYANDFSVPAAQPPHAKRALIIFPHADDETNVAGLAQRMKKQGTQLTFVVLTRGENGTPDAHLDERLKDMRAAEMERACRHFGGSIIQQDFGDGQLAKKRNDIRAYLDSLFTDKHPDVVITYDLAGLYGHPDHITCTEIITELLAARHPGIRLWYAALPSRMPNILRFPIHMATDKHFAERRAKPSARVFIGRGVFSKIGAIYSHKSQRRSFRSAMPWHLPIWLVYSLQIFEYYERVR